MFRPRLALSFLFLTFTPLIAAFEVGLDANYLVITNERTYPFSFSPNKVYSNTAGGIAGSVYLHVNIPVMQYFAVGFGPFVSYSSFAAKDLFPGNSAESFRSWRPGGDVKIAVTIFELIQPYCRVRIGYEFLNMAMTTVSYPAADYSIEHKALQNEFALGFDALVSKLVALYAQVGVISLAQSPATIKLATFNGISYASLPVFLPSYGYSGFVITSGIRFRF